jgi:DNA-binding transcriptional ArsR family regulator
MERRVAGGAGFADLVPTSHLARREAHASMMRDALEQEQVYVVPLGLTSDGQFFFAIPGTVVVAFGPEAGRKAQARRELAEGVAQRFKVLSDPTRAALLNLLRHRPVSVTDLACYFELSQPTVSVHVKMLREAGLLQAQRSGAQTLYSATPEAVTQFVEGALADLLTEPAVADLPPISENASRAQVREAREQARRTRDAVRVMRETRANGRSGSLVVVKRRGEEVEGDGQK